MCVHASAHVTVDTWPDVFLNADLFGDGQRQDEEAAEQHQGEALVSVEVVRHLWLGQTG